MRRTHPKNSKPYRPFFGSPYRIVFDEIAKELNKTSIYEFDDLAAGRHAAFELWKRIFPHRPFPSDADVLRVQYHRDPGTKDSVQSA
jgi:hypothetical protein